MELERDGGLPLSQNESPVGATWVHLAKYCIGELEPGERAEVERWLAADHRRADVVAQVRAAWALRAAPLTPVDVELALTEVAQRAGIGGASPTSGPAPSIASYPTKKGSTRGTVSTSFPARGVWSVATLAVLAVAVSLLTWSRGVFQKTAIAPSAYATANGQRATITLSDGSTVALDVASRLEVPADFAAGHRTVRLVGAALFTVVHHTGTPFTVVAGSAVARDLGTSFMVRHYAADSLTTIAVRDGKVAVHSTVLTAGHQVTVTRTAVGAVQAADPTQFSFATGVLALDGMPFPQAIIELNRWYDADIRLGDPSLASRQVAGEYAAGSLADLADILAGTFNVRVVRHGRILTLFPR